MKPKQLILTALLFILAFAGMAQPKTSVSERLMLHDTSLALFQRNETSKFIVAVAIEKPTRMYYLIDRYGVARDSIRMSPDDYQGLIEHQYDAFAYYPAAINLKRQYRNQLINELRTYKRVRLESPYYHVATYDHPELIRPDSSTLLNGIIRLERENMRDSIYLWAFNINDPKNITGVQNITSTSLVSNQKYSPRIIINPDRFSKLCSAELDTDTQGNLLQPEP